MASWSIALAKINTKNQQESKELCTMFAIMLLRGENPLVVVGLSVPSLYYFCFFTLELNCNSQCDSLLLCLSLGSLSVETNWLSIARLNACSDGNPTMNVLVIMQSLFYYYLYHLPLPISCPSTQRIFTKALQLVWCKINWKAQKSANCKTFTTSE